MSQSNEMWDRRTPPDAESDEIRYLEIGAVGLQSDTYSLERIRIADAPSRARMMLRAGDLVLSTTRPHRGAIARIRDEDAGAIASTGFAVLRNPNAEKISRDFLLAALLSDCVLTQMLQRSSGGAYPAITPDELNLVRIPTPPLDVQARLVVALDAARSARRAKLAQADALLASLDAFVLDALGLIAPSAHDPSKPFAVRLKSLRGSRLDPPAYAPFPIPSNPRRIPIEPLAKVAAINANGAPRPADNNAIVPYVGLPECDLHDVREVATRIYAEVKGRSIAHVGDILFARIEPSIFNKKYVFVEHLSGHDHVYLSTEFYTVRAHGDEHDQRYLYALFLSAFVFNQVRGKTTGSSGRRRLDPEMFASLLFPWPDRDIRKKIAAEVARRRAEARRLRDEARTLWDDAKRSFEEELLGPERDAEEPKAGRAKGRRKR